MKGFVDKNTCIGCGLCESICPGVFSMDDDGKAKAIDTELDGGALEEAREAESQCPVTAISSE